MKRVKTLKSEAFPLQTAVVLHDDEWQEYRVQFFLNGEHMTAADYHTDEKADATATAKTELAREWQAPEVDRAITVYVSDQLASDIMTTAAEGGSNYWAHFEAIANREGDYGAEWAAVIVTDTEDHDETEYRADLNTIRAGLRRIMTEGELCGQHICDAVAAAVTSNDAGNLDADAADVVLQIGLFGRIIYG
jgi:hypothetical protein